jgi:hypothetical protein
MWPDAANVCVAGASRQMQSGKRDGRREMEDAAGESGEDLGMEASVKQRGLVLIGETRIKAPLASNAFPAKP